MMIEWRKRPDLVTLKQAKMMEATAGRIPIGFVGLLNTLGHYPKN
jgi:S-adenosylmethionine synthetase